jgi:hypothetical protein
MWRDDWLLRTEEGGVGVGLSLKQYKINKLPKIKTIINLQSEVHKELNRLADLISKNK